MVLGLEKGKNAGPPKKRRTPPKKCVRPINSLDSLHTFKT